MEDEKLPEIIPDYLSDSSDDEITNTIGNVPISWYDEYDHIGYDINGQKILKPASRDQLDTFLSQMDNPEAWKSVFNTIEGKNVVLTTADLKMIKRIQDQKYPDESFDPYPKYVDFFTCKKEIHPLSSAPEPKRRFIPSKWEAKKIMKIVRSIRKGWIAKGKAEQEAAKKPLVYSIWEDGGVEHTDAHHIPAPKLPLPKNNESYNPPEEYVPDEEEAKQIEQEMEENKMLFIPKKYVLILLFRYSNMRSIPAYSRFIGDRFDRCLDLYLCPRTIKKRIQINQEALIPKLPDPQELKPYPTFTSIIFKSHTAKVNSVSVNPTGQYLASGSDDCSVKVWEISTGRMLKSWLFEEEVCTVAWNPSKSISLLALAMYVSFNISGKRIILIDPKIATNRIQLATSTLFSVAGQQPVATSKNATWTMPTTLESTSGFCRVIMLNASLSHLTWHRKVHNLSSKSTQAPFRKSNGTVLKAQFHPKKPILYLATSRHITSYNLSTLKLDMKLYPGCNFVSSLALHNTGDHVLVGSHDAKTIWFDTDLSKKPYKVLKYHGGNAVRGVAFHGKYPLFASCGQDGNVNVFYSMVYDDMLLNPLIVPVKRLSGEGIVYDCTWHPSQPWIIAAYGDGMIRMYS